MDYKNSKIYSIRSHKTDKYYIGSTCSSLSKRFCEHKRKFQNNLDGIYRYTSSFDIIKFDDAYIELLEDFKCDTKDQLLKREGELIRIHKDNIVNMRIEGRKYREYADDPKTKDKRHKYYIDNLEKIKQKAVDNKDIIAEKQKLYNEKNKDILRQKINCECGSIYSKADKSKHLKTKKHINFIDIM